MRITKSKKPGYAAHVLVESLDEYVDAIKTMLDEWHRERMSGIIIAELSGEELSAKFLPGEITRAKRNGKRK